MNEKLVSVRAEIDTLTKRLVARLKDRSEFPLNPQIYKAGAVSIEGNKRVSLLEFTLESMEQHYVRVRRFEQPHQYPLIVEGNRGPMPIKDDLIKFYMRAMYRLCKVGIDSNFRETANCDADLISMMNQRVHLGIHVAELKIKSNPEILKLDSYKEIEDMLRNKKREVEVMEHARREAIKNEVSYNVVKPIFGWLIKKTVAIEVAYIKQIQEKHLN